MPQSLTPLPHGPRGSAGAAVEGEFVTHEGERYHAIRHVDAMPPFLMSIVSASNLWMFVASNGGLTAGRVDPDAALFPYVTADRLIESADHTGPVTLLRVKRGGVTALWEPFAARADGAPIERHLYKSVLGHAVAFEEIHRDLGLAFRTEWRASDTFGWVRTATLRDLRGQACRIELLDGFRNLLPAGVTAAMQASMSNLIDAYKRSEREPDTGLGIFALSSILSDLAEPSEALRATTVVPLGLPTDTVLLGSEQIARFRRGETLTPERDVRGRRGCYLIHADVGLGAHAARSWALIADVGRDHAGVVALVNALRRGDLAERVAADLRRSADALAGIVAAADGFQITRDAAACDHHLASVLFNVMRGGVFVADERIDRSDLEDFLRTRHRPLAERHRGFLSALPETLGVRDLQRRAESVGDADLERICRSYLPLAFARRHGDPSRPWNRFAIRVRHDDGRLRLDYQGNWRDLFQNWEALAFAFPGFVNGMITVFLCATTADGYNPYRVTRDGIEWEVPEPGHAWANIGYWSDHQIIYLQKLLEASARFDPAALATLLHRRIFSYANVPYRIAPYEAMLADPTDTITFDHDLDARIAAAVADEGTDARLLRDATGAIAHATMAEKILLLLAVKLANLVPEGGIWMNTQRPEWNDANNALVGKGLSVVTTAYLHRMLASLPSLLGGHDVEVDRDVAALFDAVHAVLHAHEPALATGFDDARRRAFMDAMGAAGSRYRRALYERGLSGERATLPAARVAAFLAVARAYAAHTLRANRRPDALYHAYGTLTLTPGRATIGRLDLMLEGQVAALSSGLLGADEALALLRALRHGPLYRADQHSYLLYPDRDLPGFLAKNRIPPERLANAPLLGELLAAGDRRIVVRDENGDVRFHGSFRNAKSVRRALADLAASPRFAAAVARDGDAIVATFEDVFDHGSFTGRSGSFFAYEGLGSIYWHMISKLLLAVAECHERASDAGAPPATRAALAAAYHDVRAGLGFHKSPDVFGAFPTDPYSHTPAHAGAQQPGMTGQVKEDVLARWSELGIVIRGGRLGFAPALLPRAEFLADGAAPIVRAIGGEAPLPLAPGTLAFTFCQVPIVYRLADGDGPTVSVTRRDGTELTLPDPFLDAASSRDVLERRGGVARITVAIPAHTLFDPQVVPA